MPIVGNLHLMPAKAPHLQLQKWAQEYGPIYSLVLGTTVVIVLSSGEGVKELLDKRSAIYSSRPETYILQDVARGNLNPGMMPYGKTWRILRGAMHKILHVNMAKSWEPYQELESSQLLVHLLDDPASFLAHLAHFTGSTTTQMMFGYRTADPNDWRHKYLVKSTEEFLQLGFRSSLLDIFPVLRGLPDWLLPVRRQAKQLFVNDTKFYMDIWKGTKAAVKNGTALPCFCSELVKVQANEGFEDALASHTVATVHEAGYDTSYATLSSFVKVMVLYPNVMRRGQEEIDRVCPDALPTMADQSCLPYIQGILKELLRWCPVATIGLPHAVTEEDFYMGYRMPKGATIWQNTWAIHLDPARYPNPEVFDPERFVGDFTSAMESAAQGDPAKRDHFAFGSGRRICPGMHVAERTVFLAVARMLWAFDFAVDPDAPEIEPLETADGIVSHPAPFKACIKPRDEKRAAFVRREWETVREEKLDGEGQWRAAPEARK